MNRLVDRTPGPKAVVLILVLCNLIAAIPYLTWRPTQDCTFQDDGDKELRYAEQTSDGFWKQLDYSVFRTLNGTLKDNRPAQTFWAVANNRAFDLVQGLLLGIVLWLGLFRKTTPEEKLESIKTLITLTLVTFICVKICHQTIFNFARQSPSRVLWSEAIRFSQLEHITWSSKDASGSSFPGDHASFLFSISTFIGVFAGWRWGAVAFLVAVLCALPRLVGGAHWATDILVGSAFIVLVSTSWTLCSRRWKIGPELFHYPSLFLMKVAGRLLPSLRPPASPDQGLRKRG